MKKSSALYIDELKSKNQEPSKGELALLGGMIFKEKIFNLKQKIKGLFKR